MPDLSSFLPTGLELLPALLLVGLSFVTSLITATFSLGGGMLMLAVLATVFPPAIVVPLHGVIQLGSNGGRALVQKAHVQWRFVLWISLGGVLGTIIGGQFAFLLPETLFQLLIGAFVLVVTWLPLPKRIDGSTAPAQFTGGVVVAAVGMVVGAAGPLLAVFSQSLPDRRQVVATHAMLMTIQNTMKVAMFVVLGFAFADYLALLFAMVASGFAGTALGSRILLRVPERAFRWGFKLLLTLVALGILRDALA